MRKISILLLFACCLPALPSLAQNVSATLDQQIEENKKKTAELVFPQITPLAGMRLMFTEQERTAIDRSLAPGSREEELASLSNAPRNPEDMGPPPPLFMGGMSYENPGNWSIWLNGRRLRSGKPVGEFEIVTINRHGVEIIWKPTIYRGIYHFTLRPRQTYFPATDEIVDGDARPPATADASGIPVP